MTTIPRRAHRLVNESLTMFRAVVLQGARQVGKSTVAGLVASDRGSDVVSLDRQEDLRSALDDPRLFLAGLEPPVVIDEVQRGGDPLLLAIKERLDASNERGQYVLTGSSNFLTVPTLSESLAGRIDLVTLWPLSVGEASGGGDELVDRAFTGPDALLDHRGPTIDRDEYLHLVCRGGYPEPLEMAGRSAARWFERYLETVLRREVESVADLRRLDALSSMARLLAARTGSELVLSTLAAELGIDRATAATYEPWLETTFLVHRLPAWSRTVAKKAVHRPKIHVCDTGLGAALVGATPRALAARNEPMTGPLTESFVVAELAKQLTWSTVSARLHHLRLAAGLEIDVVLESNDRRVVAVEVKASTVANPPDAAPMARLRDRLDAVGQDFVAGIVFHTGDRRVRLGDRLVGLPIADLWT